MNERLVIASEDAQYRKWLRHYIGTFRPFSQVDLASFAALRKCIAAMRSSEPYVVVLHADFGENAEADSQGATILQELTQLPEQPVIVAIADRGNELTAIQAVRTGAEDYLPRGLLTPQRLGESIRLAARTAERRAAVSKRSHATEAVSGTEPVDIVIPRYEILRTIGRSERAVVFLATSSATATDVALKVSQAVPADEQTVQQDLAREYEALAELNHPSVVDIYDYGVHAGREFLAMEYFPCGNLKDRLHSPLSVAQTLQYTRKIAAALSVVHSHGLIHRDLKPPNVMLRDTDDIVLIDFGLAKAMESAGHSHSGMLRGSPYYMSPEQAQGLQVDYRTDLYSLGVMLFEMLTGQKPFHGTTAIDVLQQHVMAPIPRLPESIEGFQPIVDRMLAKKTDERFASAQELTEALVAA